MGPPAGEGPWDTQEDRLEPAGGDAADEGGRGQPPADIASDFECSASTVLRALRRAGGSP